MKTAILLALIATLILTAACVPLPPPSGVNNTTAENAITGDTVKAPTDAPKKEYPDNVFRVEKTEGDLIILDPEAIDPDGDRVTYSFGKPFSVDGKWQTKIGDEGDYLVEVTASDGKATTKENVLVVLLRANRAPVISCETVTVNEGDKIDLHDSCSILDEDDQEVVVTYDGWMKSWRYTTTYDDAGEHIVRITASDKRKGEILHTVNKDVKIIVKNTNREPSFSARFPSEIKGVENDVITIPSDLVVDPDGDSVVVTYSAPFDKSGVWKTKLGDAGSYDVDVAATDGTTTVKKTIKVVIGLLNTVPTLKEIGDITVDEGETVKLPISASDREGDKVTVTISGWMTSEKYTTTYDDAGQYTVTITATDGKLTTSQTVKVTVRDRNRPPVFVTPA